jgi:cytochrome c biogenesis protein CcmG/thiol:disulfide interchange protein DsbE
VRRFVRTGLATALPATALLAAVLLAAACTSGPAPVGATRAQPRSAVLPACPAQGRQSIAASALPDLSLPCLGAADGAGGVPLRRLTGRPMVVNLWASWCGPCRAELPAFARLSTEAGGRLRVLGVASLDVPGNSISFAADNALPFPSLLDRDGDLGRDLRKRGLPVTVLVRADGSVADVYQGQPLTDTTLRALVRDALGVDV